LIEMAFSTKLTFVVCFILFVNTAIVMRSVISASAEVTTPPKGGAPTVEDNLKGVKVPLKTDDEVLEREERAMSSEGYSIAEQKQMRERAQKFEFQAEVNKLMNIIINSIYSNKEIFLRELISNASDASDKIRFLGVQDPTLLGEDDLARLDIRIHADPDTNTITITDKGVGMTKEELIANLGTIAKSGTKEFIDTLAKSSDSNLIGQFGVGFYSSFLVADKVTVASKSNNDSKQWIWESQAESEFIVTEDPKGNTLGRGTRITLHLKEEAAEYLKADNLKNLVEKYSEFINFPIYLWSSHVEEEEVEDDEDEENEDEEQVDLTKEEDETEPEEKKTKKISHTIWDWELINQTKPLWTRSSKDISKEEYNNFYKSISKDYQDPITHTHFSAEGEVEFKALLYVPSAPPTSMFETSGKPVSNIRLYVRRVFITDDFEEFLPRYLSFINGVVDSDDLPLNVSREILQQDRTLAIIKKKLVRKVIALFQTLFDNDPETYDKFYEKYQQNLKLGIIEDAGNRARLAKLLRFTSSKSDKLTTFQEYVDRMKENQNQIYYLAGDSLSNLEKSPLVERAIKSGYEVLYLTDAIDEYAASHLAKFDNKYELTNIAKEGIKFDETETDKETQKANAEEFKPLTDFLRSHLKDRISRAVVSDRLVKAPAALASGTHGFTANMERLMKAQAFVDQKQFEYMKSQRVLEINTKNPIIISLNQRVQLEKDSELTNVLADALYETAAIQSGFSIENPATFASDVHKLLKLALQLDINAETVEDDFKTADASIDEKDEL